MFAFFGGSTVVNSLASYGTLGSFAATSYPGGREFAGAVCTPDR